MTMWMVRAGRQAVYLNDFIERKCVAIGWPAIGPVDAGVAADDIAALLIHSPGADGSRHRASNWAGQIWRFLNEINIGDQVTTYDPGRRIYLIGEIASAPRYAPEGIEDMPRVRSVTWKTEVPRDRLSQSARNSLGAISTLFLVPDPVEAEMLSVASGQRPAADADAVVDDETVEDLLEQTREQSRELIKDRINRLDPYELQDLVAGVLRAMGYKTRVSPPGADRGVDILASPDGFGFEQPRIVVECKHRTNTAMGAQAIRSFLGGRHAEDKGLYVSTGGFSREARYEAERANIPVKLMDLDQLVDAITEHYAQMDSETRVLLPLAKLYWPVD